MSKTSIQLIDELQLANDSMERSNSIFNLSMALLEEAKKDNSSTNTGIAHFYLSVHYLRKNQTELCLYHSNLSLQICRKNNCSSYVASSSNIIGIVHKQTGNYFLSIDYLLKAYYSAKASNDFRCLSKVLNNIGDLFFSLDHPMEAYTYFKQAKSMYEKLDAPYHDTYYLILQNLIEASSCLDFDEEAKMYTQLFSCHPNDISNDILELIELSNQVLLLRKINDHTTLHNQIIKLFSLIPNINDCLTKFSALLRIKSIVLDLNEDSLIQTYLNLLDSITLQLNNLEKRIKYMEILIHYYEKTNQKDILTCALFDYFQLNQLLQKCDKKNYVHSLLSKIHLEQVIREREKIALDKKFLEKLSEIDDLTQIFNRRALEKKITFKLEHSSDTSKCALLLMDVDRFKDINDKQGHMLGDKVLCQVSTLLKQCFREQDIVGRLGGDEFIVFMYNIDCDTSNSREFIAKRINTFQTSLRDVNISELSGHFSVSIGATLLESNMATFAQLYNHADKALYMSKENGRNCYSFYP